MSIQVTVEFSGGLETLFNNKKSYSLSFQDGDILQTLFTKLKTLVSVDKCAGDLFLEDNTIRPGVLVLINDTDWELEDEENYILQNRDLITLTSTLHGG